jgi:hypothetical protein
VAILILFAAAAPARVISLYLCSKMDHAFCSPQHSNLVNNAQ